MKNEFTLARLLTTALLAVFFADTCVAQVFYSVVSPDGRQNWLLGTIHSEDERVLEFPPVLDQALKQIDTVALELVPDHEMLNRLAAAMRLPEGQTLSDHLDETLYAEVRNALVDHGVPARRADRLRPWAAALTLGQPPVRTGRFMDLMLARRAAGYGARPVALETLDEQLSFFTSMTKPIQVALLDRAVQDRGRGREDFEALIGAYLDADLEQLQQLARQHLAGLPESVRERFRTQGIIRRNEEMARRSQPLLDAGATLVAVGALHLPGEKGLVALLREQGNRVRAIY